jgi:hypothetical protein
MCPDDGYYVDLNGEFEDGENDFKDARNKFLAASDSFDGRGVVLTDIVRDRLEVLRKPEHADAIRHGAIAAIGEINSFASTHADLASRVAMIAMSHQMYVLRAQTQLMSGAFAAFRLPNTPDLAEAFREQLHNLSLQQLEMASIAQNAILMTHRVAEAMRSAAQPIDLRRATLEQAAHELAPKLVAKPGGPSDLVLDTGIDELAWTLREEMLTQTVDEIARRGALEILGHIPIVGIIISIGRVVSDVRARQKALRERNELLRQVAEAQIGRGPVDIMFELTPKLRDEDNITKSVCDLMQDLFNALNDRPGRGR